MCDLSRRAQAFAVEALIGIKRQPLEKDLCLIGLDEQLSCESAPDTILPDLSSESPLCDSPLERKIQAELCSRELWRKFYSLGTEMIITKAGRRMFPTMKVRLSGLELSENYIVFIDIVPVDDKRYRYVYHSSEWIVAGTSEATPTRNIYIHPDSPACGKHWLDHGVLAFDKLKLTNNRRPHSRGQVSLHSMQRYLPRIHILPTSDLTTPIDKQISVKYSFSFTFPETEFTTVTAYQNQQITRLKIASNPFAKGFREAYKTRAVLDYFPHNRLQSQPQPMNEPTYNPFDYFQLYHDLVDARQFRTFNPIRVYPSLNNTLVTLEEPPRSMTSCNGEGTLKDTCTPSCGVVCSYDVISRFSKLEHTPLDLTPKKSNS